MPPDSDRVVGIGKAAIDLLGVAPRTGEAMVELAQLSIQGGGPIANALATLATLGAKPAFFGRVSDDEFGRFILRSLRDIGVDVALAAVEPGKMSPISYICIDEQSRRRTVQFTQGSTSPLTATDLPASLLDGARMLCLDGTSPAVQIAAAERASEKGITVVLDATALGPGMGELLALTDILIGSERFVSGVAPSGEIERSLVEICRMGPRIAVVTMGEAGAVALEGEKLVNQKALDVQAVDPTGAGDVFHGAFAYAVLQGWSLEKCMPFANAAAGLTCRGLGARGHLPTLAEVMRAAAM